MIIVYLTVSIIQVFINLLITGSYLFLAAWGYDMNRNSFFVLAALVFQGALVHGSTGGGGNSGGGNSGGGGGKRFCIEETDSRKMVHILLGAAQTIKMWQDQRRMLARQRFVKPRAVSVR